MTFEVSYLKNFAVDDNPVINLAFFVRCLNHLRRGFEDAGGHGILILACVKCSKGKLVGFRYSLFLRGLFQKIDGFF